MNLLVFFDFEPKKCFRVPTLWGLYGAEWDERFSGYALVNGPVHNLLMQLFTPGSSKMEVSKTGFFDIVTT